MPHTHTEMHNCKSQPEEICFLKKKKGGLCEGVISNWMSNNNSTLSEVARAQKNKLDLSEISWEEKKEVEGR